CKFSRRQGIYRQRWKYARPCESPEGRALRISIPGILLVAIVGKGDILRFGRQSLRYVHIRNPK
ncbi:hypothetical protein, partial [Alistipes putredinis]|uniref:hypothetical protein n=1 Tax=Alistipes putredinis TaxID=28117 RepID=UPI003A95A49D